MDSRKEKIKDAATELLQIKKEMKELNINIRILESNILLSRYNSAHLYEQIHCNNQKVEQYKKLEKEIKKYKKSMFRNCGIAALVLIAMTLISGVNFIVLSGALLSYIVCVGCHIATLQGKINDKNRMCIIGRKKAIGKEDLEKTVEEENKKNRKKILQKEKQKRKLESNRNSLESKKTILKKRYQYLSNQVKVLTTERTDLANTLLEEYDCPVLDLNKPLYKGKRIK